MDRRERYDDPEEATRIAFEGNQASLWTALPGIVQSFNPGAMTCVVQPSISLQARASDGTTSPINLPLLLDCPVVFPSGGGATLTFPIKAGDECLVVFSSRCIDGWWQQGGVQGQTRMRMHDLSDGFVLVGPRSQPRVLSSVSTTTVQLRSDDGSAFIELNPTSHQIHAKTSGDIVAEATGNVTLTGAQVIINAPVIQLNGNVTQTTGSGTAGVTLQGPLHVNTEVTAQTTPLHTHAHTGVTTGAGNTGGPTP